MNKTRNKCSMLFIRDNDLKLAFEAMMNKLIFAHRLKGSGTDMQCDLGACDSERVEPREHRLVEMERSCRCRDRARATREDGLIAGFIEHFVRTMDIGWQRHMTMPRHLLAEIALERAQSE